MNQPRARRHVEADGFQLRGNRFVRDDGERYLPLYEAKMMHQFTHRWATYDKNGKTRELSADELRDPHNLPMPRYWVHEREVAARTDEWTRGWLLGFRNISNTTNERTAIFSVLPLCAVAHSMPLIYSIQSVKILPGFLANVAAFAFDFVVRQKMGGINFTFHIVKQLPVIPPHFYEQTRRDETRRDETRRDETRRDERTFVLLDFIRPRVLELVYSAWDLQPFARDLGYDGAPFLWDAARRFQLRCELDALYFHLYGLGRDDVDWVMDSFPIARRKDEARWGDYRSKRVIMALYDEMAGLPRLDAGAPDVSLWGP